MLILSVLAARASARFDFFACYVLVAPHKCSSAEQVQSGIKSLIALQLFHNALT
jgi:hypothetical protein